MTKEGEFMRYFLATEDNIPYRSQPSEGYTKEQIIDVVRRWAREDVRVFGETPDFWFDTYHILDDHFREATELYALL